MSETKIDVNYDFRCDSNGGDPDAYSATLKHYHKVLWSNPLPNGQCFHLEDDARGYICYKSDTETFPLSSDTMINTFHDWIVGDMQKIVRKTSVAVGMEEFVYKANTIGNRIIFPCSKNSINQQRGRLGKIGDRFDLTLECIRRYYNSDNDDETNPLGNTLCRYKSFFDLFIDFKRYCDFFLLQDLVSDYTKVKFFLKFNDFDSSPLPKNEDEYLKYKEKSIEFIDNRNKRIHSFALEHNLI